MGGLQYLTKTMTDQFKNIDHLNDNVTGPSFAVFRPFYRTEMMIITAKNPAQWSHTNLDPYNPGQTLMGPVVNLTILQEVG